MSPKKVVRAIRDHVGRAANELSFQAGDFFFVVVQVIYDDHPKFYEVINPKREYRGQVPRELFEDTEQLRQRATIKAAQDHVDIQPANAPYFVPGAVLPPQEPAKPAIPPPRAGNPDIIKPNEDGFYVPANAPPRAQNAAVNNPNYKPPVPNLAPAAAPLMSALKPPPADPYPQPTSPSQPSNASSARPPARLAVRSADRRPDGSWWYQIDSHASHPVSGPRTTLLRSHDELWSMHVALLNRHVDLAGRTPAPAPLRARCIPFLAAMDQEEDLRREGEVDVATLARGRRRMVALYLEGFVRLPAGVLESQVVRRFLQPRRGDVEGGTGPAAVPLGVDTADDDGWDGTVRVLVDVGREVLGLRVPDTILYEDLLYEVEELLGARIQGLDYLDECDVRVPLVGDDDLGLLLRTFGERAVFFPS
ncbi:hypothetical protein HK101_006105 [Irineochytrium annulatum]|nr:hypothetical protein HK101_006105 [Irineochytrium annulatum]